MVFVVCTVFMDVGMVFMDVDLQAGAAGRYVWGKYGRALPPLYFLEKIIIYHVHMFLRIK